MMSIGKDIDSHHFWYIIMLWEFWAYQSEMRVQYLTNWAGTLNDDEFNEFIATLQGLQVLPQYLWGRPQFAPLGRQFPSLGEIIFKVARKQFRVFGFFATKPMQFIMLHGCVKQRSQLRHDMNLAARRKNLLEAGQGTVYAFTIQKRPDR
jgi:Phage derived protein Gp49-like (DUF891)